MDPLRRGRKKWIIFGIIIAVLAALVAIGPVLVTRYMRYRYDNPKYNVRGELMIKVKGIIKNSVDENRVYLAGDNGLFYVLTGDHTDELLKNIDNAAIVFGRMYRPEEGERIEGNPVRLRIDVTSMEFPDLIAAQQ